MRAGPLRKEPDSPEKETVTVRNADLVLSKIAGSGQCFRWQMKCGTRGAMEYRIPAFGKILRVRQSTEESDGAVTFFCTQEEFDTLWKDYFDLEEDYGKIRSLADPADAFLTAAAGCGEGLRILRQDPWETLVTFILSQRKNIPAIKSAVDQLCCAAGQPLKIGGHADRCLCAFPSAEQIAGMSGNAMDGCHFGYRARYVRATAECFASGQYSIEELETLKDAELSAVLNSLSGVGPKVAACTMLFGFHRLNAFPKDVWILKAMEEHYPDGFDFAGYEPYNGVMQQYIFMYERKLAYGGRNS